MAADLRTLLECSVCLDTFSDACVLSCGHSFCSRCVAREIEERGRQLNCPRCRRAQSFLQDATVLPRNVDLQCIVDQIKELPVLLEILPPDRNVATSASNRRATEIQTRRDRDIPFGALVATRGSGYFNTALNARHQMQPELSTYEITVITLLRKRRIIPIIAIIIAIILHWHYSVYKDLTNCGDDVRRLKEKVQWSTFTIEKLRSEIEEKQRDLNEGFMTNFRKTLHRVSEKLQDIF